MPVPQKAPRAKKSEIAEGERPESALQTTALPEDFADASLRPKTLREFIGQDAMKSNLSVFINAAKERGESLDHIFLTGPPGLGKTTLAQVVANELGVEFKETSAPALDKPKDIIGILTTLSVNSVFFIDEIHRLKPAIEEMLYIAMEDRELDWVIGQGPSARTMRIQLKPFTLIGATTKAGMVAAPLISRFGITCRFSFYEKKDMETIVRRSSAILKSEVEKDAALLIASSSRGTPRVANRLLKRMRDFAQVENSGLITKKIVEKGLTQLEVDSLGLEKFDREILRLIIERYGGGPVGAETLAISIGETADTLEDYYEPYLIQSGLLQRTPRGRMVTPDAYAHLGLKVRNENAGFFF